MAYRPLSPCAGCHRHVRHDERACPFCGMAGTMRRLAPDTDRRLGRGALFVFGAATAACGSSVEVEGPPTGVGGASATTASSGASSTATTSSSTGGVGGFAAMYGVPPEGGFGGAGGDGGDGGDAMGAGGFGDLYGAPPP